ncbi:hypothetical protein [Salinimicrobium soli]|uniref:hypothetical protein n=1 Tax=Salinimicrobium soli TaxID=1254399 RepID=UPI003AAAF359
MFELNKGGRFVLFLLLTIGLNSCSSGNLVKDTYRASEDLSQVSKIAYYAPVFHFENEEDISLQHIMYTNKMVDSVLHSHEKYRIETKFEPSTDGDAQVKELAEFFEFYKNGETDIPIPSVIQEEWKKQPARYIMALYFEPEYAHWKKGPRYLLKRPEGGRVRNGSLLHMLLFDKKASEVLFYGNVKGDGKEHYIWEFRDSLESLYFQIFPDFQKS